MKPEVESFLKQNISKYTYPQLSQILRDEYALHMSDDAVRKWCSRRGWSKSSVLGDDNFERNLLITCLHAPRHDQKLFDLLIKFKKHFKPHRLWILGDFLHIEQLSKYRKDPDKRWKLQEDLDLAGEMLDELRDGVPRVDFLEGNHEERLGSYLQDHSGLFGLRCLTIPVLLKLNQREIHHRAKWLDPPVKHYGFKIHHGKWYSNHSGWTAKKHWEEWGGSGIMGHCHRGGSYLRRQPDGIEGWYEDFCMCDLNPGYGGFHNWIQGWSIAYFRKSGLFNMHQIPVIEHEFLFEGKLFSG